MQRYYKRMSVITRCLLTLTITSAVGCKSFVQVDPPISGITKGSAYNSDKSALAVLTGIYGDMMPVADIASGNQSIGFVTSQYADELQNWVPSSNSQAFYANALQNTNLMQPLWNNIYSKIYICNAALEGINGASGLSDAVKAQTMGEAHFLRAFLYFYAVNLFGDAPLALTTDYNANNTISRSPQAKVYDQIVSDLQEAQRLLTDDYKDGANKTTTDKIRPNKQTATALLARVYLYRQDWQHAEEQASAVLGDGRYELAPDPAGVFPPNSKEVIWQMAPVPTSVGPVLGDPQTYILPANRPPDANRPVSLSTYLLGAFEDGDKRYANWVAVHDVPAIPPAPPATYYHAFKYKDQNGKGEYCMVMRLAETVLIRAEARAQLNNLTGAADDINAIRNRAGLGNTTASTKPALLDAILQERRVELFTEWGHRWFDLKRMGKADALMATITPQKGGVWNSNFLLMPIPQAEILLNGHLSQNPGYPN